MGKVPNYFKSAQKELLSLGGKLIDKMKDYDKDNIPTKVRDRGVPAAPSRRRRASSPGMMSILGRFGPCRRESGLREGVGATPHRTASSEYDAPRRSSTRSGPTSTWRPSRLTQRELQLRVDGVDVAVRESARRVSVVRRRPAQVQKASKACTAMCMWVRAMHKYHQVSVMVEPKKKLLAEATAELEETMQKLAEVPTQCVEVEVEVELCRRRKLN